jgi:hypothetical protein
MRGKSKRFGLRTGKHVAVLFAVAVVARGARARRKKIYRDVFFPLWQRSFDGDAARLGL